MAAARFRARLAGEQSRAQDARFVKSDVAGAVWGRCVMRRARAPENRVVPLSPVWRRS